MKVKLGEERWRFIRVNRDLEVKVEELRKGKKCKGVGRRGF